MFWSNGCRNQNQETEKKKIRALQKLIKKGSSEYKSGLWLVKGYNTGNNQNPKKLQHTASVRA